MHRYSVSIQYAHFVQIWEVEADSKEEAWNTATTKGRLCYQTIYRDIYPERNYVTCLDKNEDDVILEDQYDKWLQEAIALGMKNKPYKL